jgi:hypothetical protein
MKKTMLHFLVLVWLFLAWDAHAGGSLTKRQLTGVAFHTGGFFLYASGWPNPNGCTRTDAVVLLATDSNYDKAYALLLAAYMSGKLVSGYSDGCTEMDGQTFNTIRGFKYLLVE